MSFFFTNLSLCPTTLIDLTADLMVNLISKLMYENLKYIYFVTTELRKKNTRFSIKIKCIRLLKKTMILKNWGNHLLIWKMNKWHILEISKPALQNHQWMRIHYKKFNSSHREHIKLPLGIMCCFKTEQWRQKLQVTLHIMAMYFI